MFSNYTLLLTISASPVLTFEFNAKHKTAHTQGVVSLFGKIHLSHFSLPGPEIRIQHNEITGTAHMQG